MSNRSSDSKVISFIIALCLVCGLGLAITAYLLQGPQDHAKEFDRNKQMMIAAKMLNYDGYFELSQKKARIDLSQKKLIVDSQAPKASIFEIKEEAKWRIRPLLTDFAGNVSTFKEQGISFDEYLTVNKKDGYAKLPWKLFYAILPNLGDAEKISDHEIAKDLSIAESFVFPIAGFGLWAPIYGYLAISSDGDTVVGTTWYEHAETPGLGANITEPWWQNQFCGKVIFQKSANGKTNYEKAPLGIIVVKGKVRDVLGANAKANSAVDGISGATFTGDGVTSAYQTTLNAYRSLFIKIQKLH